MNTWASAGGPPPATGTTGLYHPAIVYHAQAEFGDALRRLLRAGIRIRLTLFRAYEKTALMKLARRTLAISTIGIILIILLILALGGGGWAGGGYYYGPGGLLLVILIILLVMGRL